MKKTSRFYIGSVSPKILDLWAKGLNGREIAKRLGRGRLTHVVLDARDIDDSRAVPPCCIEGRMTRPRLTIAQRAIKLYQRRDADRKAGPRPIYSVPDKFGVPVPALAFLEPTQGDVLDRL
jgi:hypothetical protein